MSYKGLIDTQVRRAFNLAKDLAKDGAFTLKSDVNYNFSTKSVGANTSPLLVTKVIELETLKPPKDTNLIRKVIMFRSKGLEAINAYAKLTFDGFDWSFGDSLKNDGTVWITTIQREG